MAKFYGNVGYSELIETAPGVWVDKITIRPYSGDVIKNRSKWQPGENLNDNLVVNNIISILTDPYASSNFHNIKYVEWMGTNWKVTSVGVKYPRLLLSIGGVYNEQKITTT